MTMQQVLCRVALGVIAIFPARTYAAIEMEMVAVGSDVVLSGGGKLNLSSTANFAEPDTKTQSAIDVGGLYAGPKRIIAKSSQ